ncbi:MAG: hypothetical protein A3A82_00320 [Candidatus Pacebacteria bacterium RIFCSPLOWO2_01_FULL_47_12]|nr:MAG: hypothetical protein A3J60_03355 [Candidatus Pacebacteria bacterium RIFCSPHIGHO2_02_FULL_46_9]OGJ39235.1 MAG: hypothetical protein A3A82_00320 [Candidatus Pacebacteria bacterium RIFCSPLOWO2_01_FULL_47_12]
MAWINADRQKEICSIVEDIRIKTSFSYPEQNIVDLARELGVSVYEVDFSTNPEVNAMLVYNDEKNANKPTIYIKKALPDTRKRFTLAHELGHYVLHKKEGVKFRLDGFDYSNDSQYAKEETEANFFAATILVPQEELKRLKTFFDNNLDVIADYFGVSKEVIENRTKWLKMNPLV